MGTPAFAEVVLRALIQAHDVVAVVTRPDARSGRGASLLPTPVKTASLRSGIPVLEPRDLKDASVQASLRAYAPDVVVVAAYGLLLPSEVLELAPGGAVNVHASLLPRWRGAAPVQRAILEGDAVTGVSIMRMERGLDTGAYCSQLTLELDDLTATEATLALAELGAEALLAALPSILDGSALWVVQDEASVTYADKLTKSDVIADPSLSAQSLVRRVRASSRTAPCKALIAERGVTLLDTRVLESGSAPPCGVVACTRDSLVLGFDDGGVEVLRLKPDGRPEMDALAWARGVRSVDGARWDAPE
jgi:methionyl-tRNA formyltransferase